MSAAPGPTRRQVLQLGGLAALLGGCTSRAGRATPVATPRASAGPSPVLPPSASPGPTAPAGLEALSARLSSPLVRPGNPAYGPAARLYNPRFDAVARPAAIARCTSTDDVAACVRYAGSAGTQPIRLRAGGHSYGGWSTGPGLVVDVSPMADVVVDRTARTAQVGAGARLVDVYTAVAAQGLALAAGSCPTVGLTGLALGGGIGVLCRAYGLTCDALRAVEVVTADGRVRQVDATHDPDLLWALRGGGGGSYGAVTRLTVALQPAPQVQTFVLTWPAAAAAQVLLAWQGWMSGADRRLWSTCKLLARPADERVHVIVAGTWIGPAADLQAQLAPLAAAAGRAPGSRSAASRDYAAAMLYEAGCPGRSAADCTRRALSPGVRQPFAATSAILHRPLPSEGAAAAVSAVQRGLAVTGMVEGGISFDALGGAVADLGPQDTAFVHRQALASAQYTATWSGGADAAAYDAHVRSLRADLLPWTGSSAYVNYADPSLADYADAYWGANAARLGQVKRAYDPGGVFSFPQAVRA